MPEIPFALALMRERARFQLSRKQLAGLAFGRGGNPDDVALIRKWERGETAPSEEQFRDLIEPLPRLMFNPPRWPWLVDDARGPARLAAKLDEFKRDNIARVRDREGRRPPPVAFAVGLARAMLEDDVTKGIVASLLGVPEDKVGTWLVGDLVELTDTQFKVLWSCLPNLRAGIDVGAVKNPPYGQGDKSMQMLQPLPDKDARRQLGELVKRARAARGLAHRDVAERCGVDVETFRAWEEGERVPRGRQWARLKGSLWALQSAALVWRAAIEVEENEAWSSLPASVPGGPHDAVTVAREIEEEAREEAIMAPVGPAAQAAEPPPPLQEASKQTSFGEALRVARVNAGFTQMEMGELLGVGGGALSNWENEQTTPVLENWLKLVDLVPELRNCVPPGVQHRPKPVGNRMFPRAPTVDSTAPRVVHDRDSAPVAVPVPVPTPMPPAGTDADLAPLALKYAQAVRALRRADAEVARLQRELTEAGVRRERASREQHEAQELLMMAVDEG